MTAAPRGTLYFRCRPALRPVVADGRRARRYLRGSRAPGVASDALSQGLTDRYRVSVDEQRGVRDDRASPRRGGASGSPRGRASGVDR